MSNKKSFTSTVAEAEARQNKKIAIQERAASRKSKKNKRADNTVQRQQREEQENMGNIRLLVSLTL